MPELLAHLVGDYILQNHWMANEKTRAWLPALVHAAIYTAVFALLTQDWRALAVIGGTHLLIDRFRLARYWVEFWGVGVEGRVIAWIMERRNHVRVEVRAGPEAGAKVDRYWLHHGDFHRVPVTADAPPFLGVWLLILVDNTAHLTINHLALAMVAP